MAPFRNIRPKTPQSVFDAVARRYDLLNSVFSLGFDHAWRKRAVEWLKVPPNGRVLDVATGTGAVALVAAAKLGSGGHVIGCDLNWNMLSVGRRRIAVGPQSAAIVFVRASGEALPFRDSIFDGVMIAFAIDDMDKPSCCASEMFRVLKPGGQIALLELSLPQRPILLTLYRLYLRLLPSVTNSSDARIAYKQLRKEILNWQGNKAIEGLFADAGFVRLSRLHLAFGIATLYGAEKPTEL